jgi:hypothetical protein
MRFLISSFAGVPATLLFSASKNINAAPTARFELDGNFASATFDVFKSFLMSSTSRSRSELLKFSTLIKGK